MKGKHQQFNVHYRQRTTLPIRDMHNRGRIVFLVDAYGWTNSDMCTVPGGSAPYLKAIERMGLDPNRYQATIWDMPI